MSKSTSMKPLALAMGAAFVTSLAGASVANAAGNPFGMTELSSGYMVAENKMKDGSCGGKHMKESDGSCGGKMKDKMKDGKMKDGSCGGKDGKKMKEGSCGGKDGKKMKEGNCGGKDGKKMKEGSCGGKDGKKMEEGHGKMKKMKDGSCGEGKCAGNMKKK
ncbi:FIG024746: hypothetical protein [hydrothermal vent metagenome]|uniref:Low-complexity protein n=1 Tax=hydrothermal vent metagenome TaxID=652676 RepID=A0A3B0YC13_9ZZZZ